jgi:hypothetical protein
MYARHRFLSALLGSLALVSLAATPLFGQTPSQNSGAATIAPQAVAQCNLGPFAPMVVLRDFHSKRASSWDRTGGDWDWLPMGKKSRSTLLTETGAGCIKHIYWTYIQDNDKIRASVFRDLVLRMYWDGAQVPSVEVPLGDFFGVTNGVVRPIRSLAFVTNNGDDGNHQTSWGFNCYLPMPFAKGARIEIENTGNNDVWGIWYHIDYELYDDVAAIPANAGRLHACWRRVNPTVAIPASKTKDGKKFEHESPNLTGRDNYVILDTEGDGQFVGYFLTVVNLVKEWWGEGDDMIFIDGEPFPPSHHGTGTEEVSGGGAGPSREYTGPYTGFHYVENRGKNVYCGANGMYRFCINDPIRFRKSIRVTIEHGHANNLANDYSSVAFWYQREPNHQRAPLPPLEQRQLNFLPPSDPPPGGLFR